MEFFLLTTIQAQLQYIIFVLVGPRVLQTFSTCAVKQQTNNIKQKQSEWQFVGLLMI